MAVYRATCENCERRTKIYTRIWTNIILRIRILQYGNCHHHSREIGALRLQEHIKETYNLFIATSLAQYEDVILRIGHMGENAFIEKVLSVLTVIDNGLRDLGFKGKGNLGQLFLDAYKTEN